MDSTEYSLCCFCNSYQAMSSYDSRVGASGSGDALVDALSQRLREAESRRSECERAHREALAQLRSAQSRPSEPTDHLHSRVRELDKKAALETVRCEELQLELAAALRRSGRTIGDIRAPNIPQSSGQGIGISSAPSWQPARPPAPATEIERIMAKIEQDNRILAELEHSRSTTHGVQSSGSSHALGDYHSSPLSSPHHSNLANHAPISQSSTMPTLSAMHTSSQPYSLPSSTSVNYSISHNPVSAYSSNPVSSYSTGNYVSSGQHNVTFANPVTATLSNNLGQISSTLSGIQSTIPGLSSGLTNNVTNMGLSSGLQSQLTNNLSSGNALTGVLSNVQNTGLSSGLTSALTGMPNSLTGGIGSNLTNPLSGLTNTNLSGLSSNLTYGQGTYTNPLMSGGLGGTNAMNIKLKPLEEMELGAGRYAGRAATPVTPHHQQSWALDTLGGSYGIDGIGALNPGFVHSQARPMSRLPGGLDMDGRGHYLNGGAEGQVDMLDIPGKGRCCVYIARYNYDPPDVEAAEGELSISAGDYLLVWGNGPEPGSAFLDAELLDGRRGLVPAQFVQRLVGDDLLEFHQAVVSTLRDADEGLLQSDPSLPMDMTRLAELQEVGPEGPEDDDSGGPGPILTSQVIVPVPAPRQLTLERQLNKSVLIGWTAPEPHAAGPAQIDSYHVYVDGVLKTTVKATERTRALVEGVDSNRPHRISVRSVTVNRRVSRDAACTMVIGRDTSNLGPSCVKATGVTCSQAVISWLPANSNHQHVVCVNNVEVRTVKPGVYRHTITGLAPSTQYRVTVRAKHLRAGPPPGAPVEEAPGAYTDFRTLPKGLPDPPVDIMVEAGPQDGTLLVTWQPVGRPPAAGPVTGYAVYADGKKVTDVDSPTGDHALIDINKLLGLNPKCVTVRTKSRDSQSSDSIATAIPPAVLRGVAARRGVQGQQQHQMQQQRGLQGQQGHQMQQHGGPHQQRNQQMGHQQHPHQAVLEHDENLSDKEIYPGSGQHHGHQQTSGFGTGLLKSIFDKITPGQAMHGSGIPAIEITKEAAGEGGALSGDELDSGGVHRSPHHAPQQHPPNQQMQNYQQNQQQGMRMGDQNRTNNMRGPIPNQQQGQYGPNRRAQPPGGQQGMGPHQTPPQPHKRSRLFVALFDYDPATMSPNPDACDEELPFSEGDSIKVWGDKDADGFYWGECRGRRGFVPHNMVVEMGEGSGGMDGSGVDGANRRGDRWDQNNMPLQNQTVKRMVALYDYDPQELSPNVDAEQVELSFHTGQTILVYGEMDDDGFYMGEIDGVRGLVPSNFLAEAPNDQYAQSMGTGGRGAGRGTRGHGPGARGPPPPPRDNMGVAPNQQQQPQQQSLQQQQIQPPQPRARKADSCTLPPQLDHHINIASTHQDQLSQGRGRGRGIVGSNQQGLQQGPGTSAALQTQSSSLYTTPSSAYSSAPQQTNMTTPQGINQQQQHHNMTMNQQQGMQNQQQTNQQQHNMNMNQQGMNQQHNVTLNQQQQGMQNQQTTGMQNQQGIFASRAPMKGVPSVIPQSGLNPMQQQPVTTQNQQPGAGGPNLMQKFSEMTAPGGDILSKGKELIFMKFGLGGK